MTLPRKARGHKVNWPYHSAAGPVSAPHRHTNKNVSVPTVAADLRVDVQQLAKQGCQSVLTAYHRGLTGPKLSMRAQATDQISNTL